MAQQNQNNNNTQQPPAPTTTPAVESPEVVEAREKAAAAQAEKEAKDLAAMEKEAQKAKVSTNENGTVTAEIDG